MSSFLFSCVLSLHFFLSGADEDEGAGGGARKRKRRKRRKKKKIGGMLDKQNNKQKAEQPNECHAKKSFSHYIYVYIFTKKQE